MEGLWNFLEIVVIIAGMLVFTHYLPAYSKEKGKNLATKEDIEEITRKTEEVRKEVRESFEKFSSGLQYKYKQFSLLYCKLYAIIIQSEYVRRFMSLTSQEEYSFDDEPFLEVSASHITKQHISFDTGMPVAEVETETKETPISQFNKKELCNYIIENGEYASQKLLKLAVSYRFAYHFSASNKSIQNSSCKDVADEEEAKHIKEIVCCIVSEYNTLRKDLKMEYNSEELKIGRIQL